MFSILGIFSVFNEDGDVSRRNISPFWVDHGAWLGPSKRTNQLELYLDTTCQHVYTYVYIYIYMH